MKTSPLVYCLIAAACLIALMPVVVAADQESGSQKVIYQTSFSTDPRWVTNNPSNDYWDARKGMYHFSLEPSTGNYAYTKVDFYDGSFKYEYDLILNRIDEEAAFRFGFSGEEMDFNKGPNVLTQFTNAKFGKIMWLQVVTPGNKQMKVNSQKGDELSSGTIAYNGPTIKYELNKTYHVTANYDDNNRLLTMKVNEKESGKEIWGYFINTGEELQGMNRLYIGSKGDYGMMGRYAQGYIDNVRLTAPAEATVTPVSEVTAVQTLSTTQLPTAIATPKTVKTPATPVPVETPQSPLSSVLPVSALCIAALTVGLISLRRR